MHEDEFEAVRNTAMGFHYTSLRYTDYGDVADYELLRADGDFILIRGRSPSEHLMEYHWAANESHPLLFELARLGGEAYLTFVPSSFTTAFETAGFGYYSHWIDYFRSSLEDAALSEPFDFLLPEECAEASEATLSCRGQSRGFTGQTVEWMEDWLSGRISGAPDSRDPAVLVRRKNGCIAGLLVVCIYGGGAEKPPVLWIRELAVRPEYQRQGIGRLLLSQALLYGKEHGARRAFLAADACNTHAVRLYGQMGFCSAREDEGQINMLREA